MPYKDPAKALEYRAKWKRDKRAKDSEWRVAQCRKVQERRNNKRRAAVEHYGGKCVCCGEAEYAFLAFDHIHGGGCRHRRESKVCDTGVWAFHNGFPDILQLLCHNCNSAKHIYGVCPHQTEGK